MTGGALNACVDSKETVAKIQRLTNLMVKLLRNMLISLKLILFGVIFLIGPRHKILSKQGSNYDFSKITIQFGCSLQYPSTYLLIMKKLILDTTIIKKLEPGINQIS